MKPSFDPFRVQWSSSRGRDRILILVQSFRTYVPPFSIQNLLTHQQPAYIAQRGVRELKVKELEIRDRILPKIHKYKLT